MRSVLLSACILLLGAAEPALPSAPSGVTEFHGTLDGQRFWARLTEAKADFGGNRVLQLVYTPPEPAKLGGAHLPDCPFILLDAQLRIVAWNGRDTLAQVMGIPGGYRVTREIEVGQGKDAAPGSQQQEVHGPRGWDERIAPVLLALAWHADSAAQVPTYDLFAKAPTPSAASWQGTRILVAGRAFTAVADATGRLARLTDASGTPSLTVAAWTP